MARDNRAVIKTIARPQPTSPAHAIGPDGLRIHIRLTPKSARDALEGLEQLADGRQAVKARVRAVPEDGRANAAALRLVAEVLGVAPSRIRLIAGATAGIKTFLASGDGAALAQRLAAALAQSR